MADPDVEFIGTELGQHGSNIYFREFSVRVEDRVKNYKLGKFYVVRRNPSQPICIAEFQLIWKNIKDGRKLASAKLYFRPEDTPYGRQSDHGDDELLEADRHVAIYCHQVPLWECDPQDWQTGQFAYETVESDDSRQFFPESSVLAELDGNVVSPPRTTETVKILGFPGYCRYKACVKLLRSKNHGISRRMLLAKGAIEFKHPNTRVLFSRCKFSHPSIEDHAFPGDLKLPVFKGRPRKRKPASVATVVNGKRMKALSLGCGAMAGSRLLGGGDYQLPVDCRERSALRAHLQGIPPVRLDFEQDPDRFLQELQTFMKQIGSPITKIPKVAFTRVSLFKLFQLVNSYGGYAQVTMNHKWKRVYDALGLATTITSAATCIRRHYERLLLPYEKFLRHRHKLLKEQVGAQQTSSSDQESNGVEVTTGYDAGSQTMPPQREHSCPMSADSSASHSACTCNFSGQTLSPSKPFRPSLLLGKSSDYRNPEFSRTLPKMPGREAALNGHVVLDRDAPPVRARTGQDESPSLPLKFVIQRRRGRPPKYLKAQLEELKSLAQKARLGELCAQRTSKRGRKPKSTVLRISVGPDGTIRSHVGNLQLTPDQIKESTIQGNRTTQGSFLPVGSGRCGGDMVSATCTAAAKDTEAHIGVSQLGLQVHSSQLPTNHATGNDHTDALPLFSGYKPPQRKCLLDSLLPKIEQSCMLRKDGQTDTVQISSERGLPKYQHVKESSRPLEAASSLERYRCNVEAERGKLPNVKSSHFMPRSASWGKLPGGLQGKVIITKAHSPPDVIKNSGGVMAKNSVKVEINSGRRFLPGHVDLHKTPGSCDRKVGPPPLVPIDSSSGEVRTVSLIGSEGNVRVKHESAETMTSCPASIPTAISLSSVVSGLNIVSKPFDVESLMKPLTMHIDQSLQNIKETVDAKITGVKYAGVEGDKLSKAGCEDRNGVILNEINGADDKQSVAVTQDCGKVKVLLSKEARKGVIPQPADCFVTSAGSDERSEGSCYPSSTHEGVRTLSPFIHSIHRTPLHMVRVESQIQSSRGAKHLPLSLASSASSGRGQSCSCSSDRASKCHQHYHHHNHANRHHYHHLSYYQRSHRHYHSSDGKVTMAPVAPIDPLLRKTPNANHHCKKATANGSAKLIDYHHMEH